MPEIDWERFSQIADSVGKQIARDWRVTEKDDVKQSILLHAYERRPMIEANYSEPFLWQFAKKVGRQYASSQRDARDVEDGQYYYTPDEARMALGTLLFTDEEMGSMMGQKEDLSRARITDNLMSARLDVTKAMARLSTPTRELLMRRFVFGLPAGDDSARKAGNRAVDSLARQMNRDLRRASSDARSYAESTV
ncbi:hypothetical protein [Streptomyces sp. NPDC051546]|uniref:hypothetical protein n=1 Tax=Streptomyces sp. NPDC051546 TaxID=3365655 RepID=UPI0037A5DF7E